MTKLKSKAAVSPLVKSLPDVRLRPYIVEALGDIGDGRAQRGLLKQFANEPYLNLRPLEARALAKLGMRFEMLGPLTRYAGGPEPMIEAIAVARDARLLAPDRGGKAWPADAFGSRAKAVEGADNAVQLDLKWGKKGPARVLVLAEGATTIIGSINGIAAPEVPPYSGNLFVLEIAELAVGKVALSFTTGGRISAIWLVPRVPDLPPAARPAGATAAAASEPDTADASDVDAGL